MSICEVKFTPQDVDNDIVGILEHWLEEAKKGKFCGIVIAGVNKNRTTCTQYHAGYDFVNDMIAAAALVHHRIIVNETDVGKNG